MSVAAVTLDAAFLGGFGTTIIALVALMLLFRSIYGLAGQAGGVAAVAVGLAMTV